MKPLLQLVHISDLHIATGSLEGRLPPVAERIVRLTASLPRLGPWVRHGLDPHDPSAKSEVERFLQHVTQNGWVGPTWLVDTGDLTTFGDEDSLAAGRRLITRLGRYCTRTLSLHGNHDAWPEDFPLAKQSVIEAHRERLRTHHYPQEWPEAPQSYEPPNSPVRVELYALNSVEHLPRLNVAALGRVRQDRYWETPGATPARGHSLRRLQSQVPPSNRKVLRLLAVHHPVARVDYYPHHRLLNSREVATQLQGPSAFQLVLSGHTHALFPRHGRLQATTAAHRHRPLSEQQVQLVVGTLMQRDFSDAANTKLKPDRWAHQLQVLRLFYDDATSEIVVVRFLAGRNPGVDPRFQIRPLPSAPGTGHEEIRISTDTL